VPVQQNSGIGQLPPVLTRWPPPWTLLPSLFRHFLNSTQYLFVSFNSSFFPGAFRSFLPPGRRSEQKLLGDQGAPDSSFFSNPPKSPFFKGGLWGFRHSGTRTNARSTPPFGKKGGVGGFFIGYRKPKSSHDAGISFPIKSRLLAGQQSSYETKSQSFAGNALFVFFKGRCQPSIKADRGRQRIEKVLGILRIQGHHLMVLNGFFRALQSAGQYEMTHRFALEAGRSLYETLCAAFQPKVDPLVFWVGSRSHSKDSLFKVPSSRLMKS
jgi:hypothetical protein